MEDVGDDGDGGQATTSVPPEVVRTIRAHPDRGFALLYLCTHANPVSLPRMADQVTEWLCGEPAEERLHTRLEIYMALYHDHLSPMEADDLVVYDQEEDMVALTEWAEHRRDAVERVVREHLF